MMMMRSCRRARLAQMARRTRLHPIAVSDQMDAATKTRHHVGVERPHGDAGGRVHIPDTQSWPMLMVRAARMARVILPF
jgi:hypothetical protein